MDRKELRLKMKKMRAELDAEYRDDASFRVAQQLMGLKEFAQAETLFCYASYGAELSTEYIVGAHPRVAFPKVFPDGVMRFYVGGKLAPGFRGIPEPIGGQEVCPKATDLMVLPGLAFGYEDGARLGYGGGYYDRYLASCPLRPIVCGVGYEEQAVLDPIPQEPWDQRLDLLILPRTIKDYRDV